MQKLKVKSQIHKSKFKTFEFYIVSFTFTFLLFSLRSETTNG
jgi:hypothetical protein